MAAAAKYCHTILGKAVFVTVWVFFFAGLLAFALGSFTRVALNANIDGKEAYISVRVYMLDEFVRLRYFISYSLDAKPRLSYKLPFALSPFFGEEKPGVAPFKLPAVKRFFSRIKYDWRLSLELGTGDASQTARIAGLLNSIAFMLSAILVKKAKKQRGGIKISPNFNRECFHFRFNCMISARLGHIIAAAIAIAIKRISEAASSWSILKRSCAQHLKT